MRSMNHRAEPFASAEMLLASPDLSRFDCVVADVHLSGMNGLDLVRRLRERGEETPVILITALTDKRLDDEAVGVGAVCLLRKPFEAETLLDWIERSLPGEHPQR